jgi:hypothetical protein
MPLRACAFHQDISVSRLEAIFKSDSNALFAGTTDCSCPKCGLRFAVFFAAKDDSQNDDYLKKVLGLITNDCKRGKHQGEYQFNTMP